MSGIYFHIPFCKKRCNYCDFYKSTDLTFIKSYIIALKSEMKNRLDYLVDKEINTIYFGGGTPSLLTPFDIEDLLLNCKRLFNLVNNLEITIEANPDDLSIEYLKQLKDIGINRLSIGIQSFSDVYLQFMGRRHSSSQAIMAVKNAQNIGFDNISVDLIYGIPGMSFQQWQENLKEVFELNIQHISAYHLTYHEDTTFWNELKNGKISEIDEENSFKQFNELIELTEVNGFVQYEVSNFSKEGFYSKHNSSYWKQQEYIGLGPSAHSYNGFSRQWNVSDVKKYIELISMNETHFEVEQLSVKDQFNDYIITSLRTIWGVDLGFIKQKYGDKYLQHTLDVSTKYINSALIEKVNNVIRLTKKGIFISDGIITDLMIL